MPETLAQKQERFLEQTLAPDQVLDAAGQAARGIVQPAALKPVLFEEGARLESPAITADRRVFIGAHSYMNGQGYLRSNVFIGRFCSIGRRVTIGAGGHRMTGLSTSPLLSAGPMHRHYDAQEVAALGFPAQETIGMPTIIGSDVWIGDGAIIMPGVHVGVGAVTGPTASSRATSRPMRWWGVFRRARFAPGSTRPCRRGCWPRPGGSFRRSD